MKEFFSELGSTSAYAFWIIATIVLQQLAQHLRTWKSKSKLDQKVDTIVTQITPNGGSSLVDKVDKLIVGQNHSRALLQAYFAVMMNRDDEALFRADQNGLWTFCNNKITDIFGMYHRDMLGKGWEIAIGPDLRARHAFVQAWQEYYKEGSPLSYPLTIINQETKEPHQYTITAESIMDGDTFLFFLGKVTKQHI